MPVLIQNGEISILKPLGPLAQFPGYLKASLDKAPATHEIETQATELVAENFPENKTANFVKSVCRWGNYNGVAGKVLKHNRTTEIGAHFKAGHAESVAGDPARALEHVIKIRGLSVSFGSKHLKFLHPDGAVVLDSIIRIRLGYEESIYGYAAFLGDCFEIRDILNTAGICRIDESTPSWRVSDVEMAVYYFLTT